MTLKRSSSSSLFRSANCAHCFDAPAEALRRERSRVNWRRQLKGSSVAAMVVVWSGVWEAVFGWFLGSLQAGGLDRGVQALRVRVEA